MFDEDDEPETPPEVEYEDLRRRFLATAAGWVAVIAFLWAFGFMELEIAIVIAASGGGSALALAGYWDWKLRQLGGR